MDQATATFRRHGGRLATARAAFPDAPEPWLDLSTGISPFPWPTGRAPRGDLRRLPAPEALAELEAVAGRAFGSPPQRVVALAGADAALRLLPLLTGAPTVAIGSPTYSGHAEAWRAAGAEVAEVPLARLGRTEAKAAVIVHPNNPDGAICEAATLADGRRWLIVDESFIETMPALSLAGLDLPRTIVLRSFGKFYGLPGLRLGFLIAEPEVALRARRLTGDWPVSAQALAIGAAAYADQAFAARARARLARAAARLDSLLTPHGFQVVGGTSLFRLTRSPDAARRFEILARQGVLTRPFDHDPALLRFGLPAPGQWKRLAAALAQL